MLRARTASGFVAKAGEQVFARIDPAQAHFFDTASGNSLGSSARRSAWHISSSRTSPRTSAATPRCEGSTRHRRRRVLRAARPDRRRQDDDAAPDRRAREADRGPDLIDGDDVADWGAAERDVALVLQQYSLYPRCTVRENLEFPLKSKIRRVDRAEIEERVAARPRRCASSISSTARPTGCPAARCSASRSAGRSCASRACS